MFNLFFLFKYIRDIFRDMTISVTSLVEWHPSMNLSNRDRVQTYFILNIKSAYIYSWTSTLIAITGIRMQVCIPCPRGRYVDTGGATVCTNCPIGTYADVTGLYRCKLCPPGTFGKDTGRVACEACVFGKNTFNSNQTVCSQCREGTYSGEGFSTVREWLLGVFPICPIPSTNDMYKIVPNVVKSCF